MDFGDVLNQWEQGKAGEKNARRTAAAEKKAHPLDIWLRSNKVSDKDSQAEETPDAAERRRRLRQKKPDDFIDIHGLTRDEAWIALESFFNDALRRGLEKVLIIHGKGNHSQEKAVLKHCVREFTEKCPFAGECGQSDTGGSGATWVVIKQESGVQGLG